MALASAITGIGLAVFIAACIGLLVLLFGPHGRPRKFRGAAPHSKSPSHPDHVGVRMFYAAVGLLAIFIGILIPSDVVTAIGLLAVAWMAVIEVRSR